MYYRVGSRKHIEQNRNRLTPVSFMYTTARLLRQQFNYAAPRVLPYISYIRIC